MKKTIIALLFLCSLNINAKAQIFLSADDLKLKSDSEIFALIQGDYVSSTQQTGWSPQKPFTGYAMTITIDHKILLYHKSSDTATTFTFLYKLDLTIINVRGYLNAQTKMNDMNQSNAVVSGFQDWLKGMFSISSDTNKVMFSNDLETDGGPATTWVRSSFKIEK